MGRLIQVHDEFDKLYKSLYEQVKINGWIQSNGSVDSYFGQKFRKLRSDGLSLEQLKEWFVDSKWSNAKPQVEVTEFDVLYKELCEQVKLNGWICRNGYVVTSFGLKFRSLKDKGYSLDQLKEWFVDSKWSKVKPQVDVTEFDILYKELFALARSNGWVDKKGSVVTRFGEKFRSLKDKGYSLDQLKEWFYQSQYVSDMSEYSVSSMPLPSLWIKLKQRVVSNGYKSLNEQPDTRFSGEYRQAIEEFHTEEAVLRWFEQSKWAPVKNRRNIGQEIQDKYQELQSQLKERGWVQSSGYATNNLRVKLTRKFDRGVPEDEILDWLNTCEFNQPTPEFLYQQYANDPEFTNRTIKEVFSKHRLSLRPLLGDDRDYDYLQNILRILTEEVDAVFARLFNNKIRGQIRSGLG